MPPSAKKKGGRRSTCDDEATQKLTTSPQVAEEEEETSKGVPTTDDENSRPSVSQVAFEKPPQEEQQVAPVPTPTPVSPTSVPFVCLLCFRPMITDPVVLHDTISESPTAPTVCIACSECSIRWYQLQQCITRTHGGENDDVNNNNNSNTLNPTKVSCPVCTGKSALVISPPCPSQVLPLHSTTTTNDGESRPTEELPKNGDDKNSHPTSSNLKEGSGSVLKVSPFPTLAQWRRDHVMSGGPTPVAQICNPHTGESTGDRATSALDTRTSIDGRSSCGVVRFDTPSMMELAPGAVKRVSTSAAEVADDELSTHPMCGICEEAPGSVDCLVCGFSICEGCQGSVHAKGRYRQHQVVPIGEIAKVAPRRCICHPTHNLDLYCRKCDVAVCVLCSFSADMHKGHDVVPLEEMAKETAVIVAQATSTLSKMVERSEAVGNWVANQEEAVTNKCNGVVGDVQTYFSALRKVLDDREAELVGAVATFHDGKVQRLRVARDTFRLLARDGSVVRDSVGALPTTTHPIVTVGLAPAVKNRLDALRGQIALLSPQQGDLLQLGNDKRVEEVVADIGKLFVPDVAELRCEFPSGSTSVQTAIKQLGSLRTPNQPIPPPANNPPSPISSTTTRTSTTKERPNTRHMEDEGLSPQVSTVQPRASTKYAEPYPQPDDDPFPHRESNRKQHITAPVSVVDGQKRPRDSNDGDHQHHQHQLLRSNTAAPNEEQYREGVSRRRQFMRFDEDEQPQQQQQQQQHHVSPKRPHSPNEQPHTAPPAAAPAPRSSLHGIAKLFDTTRPQRRASDKKKEGDSKDGGTSTTTSGGGGGIRLNIS